MLSLNDLAAVVKESPAKVRRELLKGQQTKKETQATLQGNHQSNSQAVPPAAVRQYLKGRKFKYPQQIVSVQMLKGGVAKTTTVLNMGLRAAMYGARVLFVDLDQQANLTFALGVESEDLPVWVEIVEKKVTAFQAIQKIGYGIDIIPSNLNNSVLDRVLMNSNRNWAQAVSGPLAQIRENYDLILIDTAPALSTINTAVAIASDLVVLPMSPDRFSWLGLKKHRQELEEIQKDFGAKFKTKILFTRFDGREKSSHEILQDCIDSFADQMMQGYIRTSAEVKNTIGTERNIFQTNSPVKDDYDLITREILDFI
ncbi:MAG: ParA family protein [Bdellovibrionaceae bacterium]|nr:ParA family protein [Pseudobdellovibrionaceae bacterium]